METVFKAFPVDIELGRRFEQGFAKKFKLALLRLLHWDISESVLRRDFKRISHRLKGFDIVQLINESPFQTSPQLELEITTFLHQNNKKLFLLSCGTDYTSVHFAYAKKIQPSIFTPFFEGKMDEKQMGPALKYLKPEYKQLHDALFRMIDGVIATDLDYHFPLRENAKYFGLIPNPINIDKLNFIPFASLPGTNTGSEKIIIFHGINRINYYKKGNDLFESALQIIAKKYPDQVEIITAETLPYAEYISKYNQAHILLDQNYAQDQGYNALEAMAKGKVVFTGAGKAFCEHYGLAPNTVAINTKRTAKEIAEDLEHLIKNPEIIKEISKNARNFIEEQHDYKRVVEEYFEVWKKRL